MKPLSLLKGLAWLCHAGFLCAAPIPGLYNTGVDNTGALLGPNGVVDPHYRLTVSPDATLPGPNAVTLSPVWPLAPAGPWIADGPHSRWISPSPVTSAGPGSYTYTTTFNITGFNHETARIEGNWATDDGGTAIILNGNTVHTGGGGFGGFTTFFFMHDSGGAAQFLPGENTLEFVVSNGASGPTGLRVEMNGFVDVPNEPPSIRVQPPTVASAFEGNILSISAVADGSEPLTYQWKKNGAAMPGQNANYLELIGELADSGEYTLEVKNTAGTVTSNPVRVYVLALLDGVFVTGVNANGETLADGEVDPHYKLIVNPDTGVEDALVQDTQSFPISTGNWVYSNPDGVSRWIGPQFYTNSSAGGDYTFRTTFDLTGQDPASVLIELDVTSDNFLTNILINGSASGVTGPGNFGGFTPLTLRAGVHGSFLPGVNTLDFVVNNASAGPIGLHIGGFRLGAATGTGTALKPSILRQPTAAKVMQGDSVTIDVLADGTAPLTYQWSKDGTPLAGKTAPILTLDSTTASDGGQYSVVIKNDVGEVTSAAAAVLVVPPTSGLYNTGVDLEGLPLPDEAEDPRYELIEAPEGLATGPAVVLSGIPAPPWYLPEDNSARWIGLGPNSIAPPGTFVFRLKIDLTGYDPATAIFKGMCAADNSASIRLNGTPTSASSGGFGSSSPFTITSGFVAGINTLDFAVNNAEPTEPPFDNPAGLLVHSARLAAVPTGAAPAPPVAVLQVQPDGRVKVSYTPVAGWKPYISSTLAVASWSNATDLFSADGASLSVIANPAELPFAFLRFQYEP